MLIRARAAVRVAPEALAAAAARTAPLLPPGVESPRAIAPGCARRSPRFAGREYPSGLQTATNLGSSQANRGASLLGGLGLRGGVSGRCRGGPPAVPSSYACAALGALTAAGTAGKLHSRVWWDSGLREPLGAAHAAAGLGWAGLGWVQDMAVWRCQAVGRHPAEIIASTNLG
eukprot:jgi/Tetstr1/424686/TSEL_015206.t1